MNKFHSHWLKPLLLAGACAMSTQALASSAYVDHHYNVKQPDGTMLELVLNGTTHYADQRTIDGYPVIYDSNLGGYAYAKLAKDGQSFASTGVLAGQKTQHLAKRLTRNIDIPKAQKIAIGQKSALALNSKIHGQSDSQQGLINSLDLSGNVKGLTILIQFPNLTGTISQADVSDYANDLNYTGYGNAQSIRGYFREVSGNKLDYTNTVTRYFTASKDKSYYTDQNVSYGVRAQELIREALAWLNSTENYDFSSLSTDASGNIKGLNVFYAGESDGGWAKGLWPHQGGLSQRFCADGVCASQYQITNMSTALTIGTFIHESGHLIGNWPDLYDYDGSSDGSAGTFCVMGYGSLGGSRQQKPLPPNGYFRSLAGWETVTELNPAVNASAPTGTLSHVANSNSIYRWSNPAKSDEAFYIETRRKTGQNQHLPDEGLVVWHVDGAGDNSNEWHPYVQMEHADAARDPEQSVNRGDQYDMYDASSQASFGYAVPSSGTNRSTNSRWWTGADSGLELSNISAIADTMSFTLGAGGTDPDPVTVVLVNNTSTVVDNLSKGQSRNFKLDVPAGATDVTFTLTGSNGDADLFIKKGAIGSDTDNDCKSATSNSNESCTLAATAGTYYATVYAYSAFTGLQIKGAYSSSGGGDPATTRYNGNLTGANDKDIQPDGSYFQYDGGTIKGVLSGPSGTDFDLKLFKWSNSQWTEVAKSTSSTSQESIEYNAASGYYQFEIYSYSGSGDYSFDLTR